MNDANDPQWDVVGRRVREARLAAGMSVRELARRVGVSASHVSQVERGISAFSVPALYAVSREIDLSLHDLLAAPGARPPAPEPVEVAEIQDLVADGIVQRADDHPSIQLSSGPRWSRLTTASEADAEFLEVVYQPGTRVLPDWTRHDGREYGVIISGELNVEVEGVSTTLHPGDSIAFDSMRPHRFWNESDAVVRAIWFVRDGSALDAAPYT
jgi:transcriptional regulator with XRE-family HTH domain